MNIDFGLCGFLLSITSCAGAVYVYVAHTRRLNTQEGRLNEYHLENERRLDAERKQANIVATVVKTKTAVVVKDLEKTQTSYVINFCNKGLSVAKDIRIDSPDLFGENAGVFVSGREKFPYSDLIPETSFDVPVIVFSNAKTSYRIKLIWNDESGKDRLQEQTISF
jgi:hypothetical protein